MSETTDKTRVKKVIEGSRNNAEGAGYALAVALPTLLEQGFGVSVTPEMLSIGAALVTSVAVRIKEHV
ncbi:hypothetical protein [Halomonas sp. NO4]|uniref:hypothetical protein n=1 Tax=Halomonas sp. NO4 TaxID=2484813 RepID=UPI0013D1E112|nr:hypothetical protein [Halomonas sp. NO4]